MDSSGEQHLQINHNIYKRRLDHNGQPIAEPKKEDITVKTKINNTEVIYLNMSTDIGCSMPISAFMGRFYSVPF